MKVFEYSFIKFKPDSDPEDRVEKMSKLGDEGFELVSMLQYPDRIECYFKKEDDSTSQYAKDTIDSAVSNFKDAMSALGRPPM